VLTWPRVLEAATWPPVLEVATGLKAATGDLLLEAVSIQLDALRHNPSRLFPTFYLDLPSPLAAMVAHTRPAQTAHDSTLAAVVQHIQSRPTDQALMSALAAQLTPSEQMVREFMSAAVAQFVEV
jgi:hypothetical protein